MNDIGPSLKMLMNCPNLLWWMLAIGLTGWTGCSNESQLKTKPQTEGNKRSKPVVYTVNYPLQFFAETIGGEGVEVVFPMEERGDPAYWKPSPEVIRSFQMADLILLNGADYAKWLTSAILPESKILNTSEVFKGQWIEIDDAVTHSHGNEGAHSHKGFAFTTWLNFDLASKQALEIKTALTRLNPQKSEQFDSNYNRLKESLEELDQRLMKATADHPKTPLLASHPVYQYLQNRYRLNLISLHWEPDEVPNEKALMELKEVLGSHAARTMIWEAPPLEETKELLKEQNVESILFDPCANRPSTGDFLEVMRSNVEALIHALD